MLRIDPRVHDSRTADRPRRSPGGAQGPNYFGENVPELAVERVPVKSQRADVEIGDPVVVEDPVK